MNGETKFIKLKTRMMKWAEEKKYQTSKNSDFTIPDHPDRNKSWKEDLKLIIHYLLMYFTCFSL